MSTKITITTGTTTITVETDDTVLSVTEESTTVEPVEQYEPDAYYPNSSFIAAIYWLPDEDGHTVEMYTADGKTYRYDLTRAQFKAWGEAESAGHWYHENLTHTSRR